MDFVYFSCLCCGGCFWGETGHECQKECDKKKKRHVDWCPVCHRLLLIRFERQLENVK